MLDALRCGECKGSGGKQRGAETGFWSRKKGKCFLNCIAKQGWVGGGYSRDDRAMVVKVLHNYKNTLTAIGVYDMAAGHGREGRWAV